MDRITHILVVVDPRGGQQQPALEKATRLAKCLGCSIELMICNTESVLTEADEVLPAYETALSSTLLRNFLAGLAQPLRAQGIDVTVRLIYGTCLHKSLLDYLYGSNADLVIKDTHHHPMLKRIFLANTDWHLARSCPVSMLFTKAQPWGTPPSIMAGIDPDEPNEQAAALDRRILNCGASLAGTLAADFHVVHSFIPKSFAAVVASGRLKMTEEYSVSLQVETAFKQHQVQCMVNAFGVTPEHLHVEMGTPNDCLSQLVANYHTDIVVMGASAHGRWHRMLVGSTASTILESLPCDILIVKPVADAHAL